MHHRHPGTGPDLHHAADVPSGNHIGVLGLQRLNLARLQLRTDFGLQQVVGARRAAAQMAVSRLHHVKPHPLQQILRRGFHLLAMLQTAGRVIGHPQPLGRAYGQADLDQKLADIHGKGRYRRGLLTAQHMAIIFHRGAAPAGVDDHRIQTPGMFLRHEGRDIGGGRSMGLRLAPHVMRQRPAAPHAARDDHLTPQTAQQADRGIVNIGVQRLLRTTRHQGHPHPALARGGKGLGVIIPADRRNGFRRHRQHGA